MSNKDTILTMFKWNAWANEKYRVAMGKLALDDLKRQTEYGRLLDRIVHIFASFEMWQERMKGNSPQTVISADDFDSLESMFATWRDFEQLLIKYVQELPENELGKEVTYTSFDGTVYTRKIRHILMHLSSHPNYHRGQISAIFKQADDLPDLPSTDMVVYFLESPDE